MTTVKTLKAGEIVYFYNGSNVTFDVLKAHANLTANSYTLKLRNRKTGKISESASWHGENACDVMTAEETKQEFGY